MNKHIHILSTKKLNIDVMRKALSAGLVIMDYDFIRIGYTNRPDKLKEVLVFSSRHAVIAFAEQAAKRGIHSQRFKAYCLQGETLNALQRIDGVEILGVARDARSLANKIIADNRARELSFICGHQRRDELPDLLQQHGIQVQEEKVYETYHTGVRVMHEYNAVLFFSPSAAESFFQTNVLAPDIPCFCIGATTAASVKNQTRNFIITAEEPSQESMFDALKEFYINKLV